MWLVCVMTLCCAFEGCSDPVETPPVTDVADVTSDAIATETEVSTFVEIAGTQIFMDFTRSGGFYSAPFPDESRRLIEDGIDLSDFPNPDNNVFLMQLLAAVNGGVDGFGTTSTIYFTTDAPIDTANLPDLFDSTDQSASIWLVSVDPESPDYQRRYPFTARFDEDGGPFGTTNLLALLPLQGIVMRPDTRYAAVVFRDLGDVEEQPLGVSAQMAELTNGEQPDGMSEAAFSEYLSAIQALEELEVDVGAIAGLAVFRTGSPTRLFEQMVEHVVNQPIPQPNAPFEAGEVYDGYCVYHTTISMPVFQSGEPPFTNTGGGWTFDEAGDPIAQGFEEANLVATIPRSEMPTGGFPVVVFVRTGGGGDRPLVDRGVWNAEGELLEAGSGPASNFAAAGFAGVSVDGPHGGLRNVTGGDEQFLVYNPNNPVATRDNIRQSALELVLLAHILDTISIDMSDCPDANGGEDHNAFFDVDTVALMGHSTGATIAPLTLAFEPRYRAAILSGAGGSWINNIIHKDSPVEARPLAELIIGYVERELHEHDPTLMLLQWSGESADPPVYAGRVTHDAGDAGPRHVLMLQGIVDTYIYPPMANATSLSFGLDLAGPALDETAPELAEFHMLSDVLQFSGGEVLSLPAQGNVVIGDDVATAIVVQHLEDGVQDGHEVVFQTEAPKHQYRCFLESLLEGVPTVVVGGGEWDGCE